MMNILNRGIKVAARLKYVTNAPRRFMLTATQEEENDSKLPHNLIIMGIDQKKVEKRKERLTVPVPEKCEVVRTAKECPKHRQPSRIWLDDFNHIDFSPTQAVELHPEVFSDNPRIDFLYLCKQWQSKYREVDYTWLPTRAEVGHGRRKPWPGSGTGRARQASRAGPEWKGGGTARGPRGPKSLYQKMNPTVRLRSLTSALSVKYYQEDITVLENLDISLSSEDHLREIFSARGMSYASALVVYSDDDMVVQSDNIFVAAKCCPEINLMPLVGLNVWGMLHHDKLILTLQALEELESKILWNIHRFPWIDKPHNFYRDLPFNVKNSIE